MAGVKAGAALSMHPSQKIARSPDGDRILVIMAKAPKPGMVKTRLTACLPTPAVVELYRCLLDDTIALARSLRGLKAVIMCPGSDVRELSRAARNGPRVVAQTGEGLAAGLTSVFARFAAGRRRIIAFNSDSPHLPASTLRAAFEALATHDLVVGPTYDGGYYLVGATASHPGLFTGSAMGTKNALEALQARAQALRLSVCLIEPFYDIDVAADLSRLSAELQLAPARAPRTAKWLVEWSRTAGRLEPSDAKP